MHCCNPRHYASFFLVLSLTWLGSNDGWGFLARQQVRSVLRRGVVGGGRQVPIALLAPVEGRDDPVLDGGELLGRSRGARSVWGRRNKNARPLP